MADKDGKEVVVEDTANKDDEIQIEIEGAEASPIDKAVGHEQTSSPAVGVEELRRQLADAQARGKQADDARIAAERRVSEVATTAVRNRDDAFVAYEQAAANGIKAGESALAEAKLAYKNAAELGDFGKMADAQAAIADATISVRTAKSYQAQVADAKKNIAAQEEQARKRAEAQAANNQNNGVQGRSKDWIDAHPQFNTDPNFQKRVVAASLNAQAKGISIDSDAYFEFVEKEVGLKPKDTDVVEDRKPNANTGAPPSRGAGNGGGGGGPQKVKLSAAELEAAAISGRTPVQYAKDKLALIAEGKLGRTGS